MNPCPEMALRQLLHACSVFIAYRHAEGRQTDFFVTILPEISLNDNKQSFQPGR